MAKPANDNRALATRAHTPPTIRVPDQRALSLYATCQPSGGLGGEDARSTNATNIKRRRTVKNSKLATRPAEAKRPPKVHASRPDRADLTGTRNPRKPTNPGNRKPRRISSTRNAIALVPTPRHQRPLSADIY